MKDTEPGPARRYRLGRSLGLTVYEQTGDAASKDDRIMGFFREKADAALVVDALNAYSQGLQER